MKPARGKGRGAGASRSEKRHSGAAPKRRGPEFPDRGAPQKGAPAGGNEFRFQEQGGAGGAAPGSPAALHAPVLLQEVLSFLEPADGQRYLDATLGLGGHSEAMLGKAAQAGTATR